MKLSEILKPFFDKKRWEGHTETSQKQVQTGIDYALDIVSPTLMIAFRDWWMNLSTSDRLRLCDNSEKQLQEFMKDCRHVIEKM